MDNKPVRARLPIRRKLLFTAVILAAPLLLVESLLRFCGYGPEPDLGMPMHGIAGKQYLNPLEYFALCDPRLGVRNRPNGRFSSWYIRGEPLSTTDRFGYRNGVGWPGDGKSPIVLFVGDSFTFGSEVDDGHTAPSEVAKLLSRESDVRVLNAGVRSYNTLQAKRMLIECLQRFPQIEIAVYTFCGNDLEENMVPNFRAPFKAPYMVEDPETWEFREVEVSDPAVPWGSDFSEWKPPPFVPSTRVRVTKWLEAHSALLNRCLAGLRQIDSNSFNSLEFPDGKRVVPSSQYVKWHGWAAQNGGNFALQKLFAQMDLICRNHSAAFVVTCASDGHDTPTSDAVASNCAAAGVQFVNLDDQFTGDPQAYASLRADGRYDNHYGPLGTKTYAEALAPALIRILKARASAPASDPPADDD